MPSDKLKKFPYVNEVELTVNKYAKDRQDKDDLKQEARIAILAAEKKLSSLGKRDAKRLAYDIARKRVVDILRKTPPQFEDIDNPTVRRKCEEQNVRLPDEDIKLDSETAVKLLYKLPGDERLILQSLFGVDHRQHTEEELAEIFGKTKQWVSIRKLAALKKLRAMMEKSK